MDKRKRMFYTDAALVPLFLLTLVTGLTLHGAGHAPGHADRQFWALSHLVSGAAFPLAGLLHVGMHWGWYRTLAKGVDSKSRLTLLLSLLFAVAVATGIGLLLSRGGHHASMGLMHYKTGLVMGLVALLHLGKRFRTLLRGLKGCQAVRHPSEGPTSAAGGDGRQPR